MEEKKMRIDWSKVFTNAITVLVTAVFLGAAMQLWNGVQTIDSRIDANVSTIRATQEVLAPKVDAIEDRLVEILKRLNDIDDDIDSTKGRIPLELPKPKDEKSLDLINERNIHNQIQQQQIPGR
jgi:hypothetical protein